MLRLALGCGHSDISREAVHWRRLSCFRPTPVPMRRFLPVAALALSGLLAGCNQQNFFGPRLPVVQSYLTLYAVSRAPAFYPSAMAVGGRTVIAARADIDVAGGAFYDVVVDFETTPGQPTRVRLIPIRAWVQAPTLSLPQVAIRASTADFLGTSRPPEGGFRVDSVTVVDVRQTFFLQTNRCSGGFNFSQEQWSKAIIDSVNVAEGLIRMRVATDQNCGQREFPTTAFPPAP